MSAFAEKTSLKSLILGLLPDNITGLISPLDMREALAYVIEGAWERIDSAYLAMILQGYKHYASTGAGLAGTVDQGQFSVTSGSFLNLYRNDSGTATLLASLPLAAAIPVFDANDYLLKADNLTGLLNSTAALTNLGGTAIGKALFTALNADTAQTAIGAGTGGKAVLAAASAAAARVAMGVAIGTDVQAYDADLAALAGIAGVEGDLIYRNATQWTRLAKGAAGQLLMQNAGLTAPEWGTPVFSKGYSSAQTTIALNTLYTFTHGLGGLPTLVMAFYVCKVAINGYSVGDFVPLTQGTSNYNGNTGPAIVASTTQIKFRTPSDALMESISPNGTTRTNYGPANFDLLVRAWL